METAALRSLLTAASQLLGELGVTVADTDPLLTLCAGQAELRLLGFTNRTELPTGLTGLVTRMTCGGYLRFGAGSGQLTAAGLDLTRAVSSLAEGDVTVSFTSGDTDNVKLQQLLGALDGAWKEEALCCRRLRW